MLLSDQPTLCPGLFRLPEDPVGPRVLIPAFSSATSVRGAFGWFTASWIGRLAPGLAEYLARCDTAPIDFTVAPTLFARERQALKRAYAMSADEAVELVADVFVEGRAEASAMGRHAIDCLTWMVATGRLHLRIAVPTEESNYHPKIWLFDDGRHQVLARGSGNATGRGVDAGVEHIDVDVSWLDYSRPRVVSGRDMLDDWSRGRSRGIAYVVDLPDALEHDIIRTAPDVQPTKDGYLMAAAEDGNPKWATADQTEILRERFGARESAQVPLLEVPGWLEWKTGAYAHQGEAVRAWEEGLEPERGTIAMATGAGKTLTALVCATRVQDRLSRAPFLVVVSAPSRPLVAQWRDEVAKFGVTAVAPSLGSDTDEALTRVFRRLHRGGTHVVITTNALLCTDAFQTTLRRKIRQGEPPVATLFIGDEAHTLGADGFVERKPEFFERRLALSATPERQYDPDGTEAIFAFFGPPVHEFGLDRAIGFCLVPYDYHVHAATLDGEELDEFARLSRRIGAAIGRGDDEEAIGRLKVARRRIVETAQLKIALLRRVLERRGARALAGTLVYASAKDPDQFERIGRLLAELGVRWAPVTQDETAKPRLLEERFEAFTNGGYQVLLAKKVLDEGVDIPSIREAFLVASSTIEREWIQRRGRVLRRHPNKKWAVVHDFMALPPSELVALDRKSSIKRILRNEIGRAYSFAAHARNATGKTGVMADLQRISGAYWPDGTSPPVLERPGDMVISPSTPEGDLWKAD